jgi:hypothetical protein
LRLRLDVVEIKNSRKGCPLFNSSRRRVKIDLS